MFANSSPSLSSSIFRSSDRLVTERMHCSLRARFVRAQIGRKTRLFAAVFCDKMLVTIRHSGATKLSQACKNTSLQHQIRASTLGTSVAVPLDMNRHWKAVLALTSGFVVAFIVALGLHSLVAALMLLLSALVVAYVLAVSGMRTAPPRQMRRKQASLP